LAWGLHLLVSGWLGEKRIVCVGDSPLHFFRVSCICMYAFSSLCIFRGCVAAYNSFHELTMSNLPFSAYVTDVFATSRDLVKANKQQFTHLHPKHHTKLLRVPITDRTRDLFPYLSAHDPPLDTKRLRRLPTPQRAWPKHHSPAPRVVTLRLHTLQTRAQQTHNQFTNAHTNTNTYQARP
jgi:hypothetical protein